MLEEYERHLLTQLQELEIEFRQRSAPIIEELVRLEMMKPPKPIFLPELSKEEGERIRRLLCGS